MTSNPPRIVFLCIHNAGRSQMAAGFARSLGGSRIDVASGGSDPAANVNPMAVAAMDEVGIDITTSVPRRWSDQDVATADVVVTMGCGDECPFFPGVRYEDWELADPSGLALEDVRPIRDEIGSRVGRLLESLGVAAGEEGPQAMTSIDLSDIQLLDPDGSPIRLGDVVDRPTVVDLVRYYGCAPCRSQMMALGEHHADIVRRGGEVMAIGPRAAYQAVLLRERIPFRLLLDPDHEVGRAIALGRQSLLRFIFDFRAWGRWLRGLRPGGQGMITGGWWEVPGILVLDRDCTVRWAHRGRSIGDYPPLAETIAQLDRVLGE